MLAHDLLVTLAQGDARDVGDAVITTLGLFVAEVLADSDDVAQGVVD